MHILCSKYCLCDSPPLFNHFRDLNTRNILITQDGECRYVCTYIVCVYRPFLGHPYIWSLVIFYDIYVRIHIYVYILYIYYKHWLFSVGAYRCRSKEIGT